MQLAGCLWLPDSRTVGRIFSPLCVAVSPPHTRPEQDRREAKMPRRKQSNPQPVKLESEAGAEVCESGCLVLESDFLLSGELEFGDSEIMGLDRESGMTVFSLSVEDDSSAPTGSAFPGVPLL
ncbi:hypothetical protein E3U43_019243 [Larimichthys crocea]|uniref:Uncharacterized protein n=1 Tax=Larimichthys crocea TaxID=215358 RepID=A0ACD3QXP0_LARCR|nr:hypothetical protein E3U43_019243 [Larimichthys crocea]